MAWTPERWRDVAPHYSKMDVNEGERNGGDDEHEAGGHEFLRFGKAHGENDEERGEEDVVEVRDDDDVDQGEGERGGESYGHDERNLAAGLEEADDATNDEQDGVDPEDESRVVHRFNLMRSTGHLLRARLHLSPSLSPISWRGGRKRPQVDAV